jgi:monoterpene epsilon-lactone hydrolase
MSKDQQEALDAILRQGPLDLLADAPTLRAAFNEVLAYVPVAGDVDQNPTMIGGVSGVEVTIRGTEATNVEDAQAAYGGLLEQGIDPGQIALAGDSAGGGLAVAVLLALRDAGTPLPSCAFLMSPYADLTLSGETILEKQAVDPILTPDGLRLRVPDYVAGADASNPHISPVFGDLSGLPPLLIQVGSHEVLLSDALRLAARAAIADVPITLEVTPGAPHVFQGYAAMLDEGDVALDRASAFLNTHFAATRPTQTA